jgi:hypothetical protein
MFKCFIVLCPCLFMFSLEEALQLFPYNILIFISVVYRNIFPLWALGCKFLLTKINKKYKINKKVFYLTIYSCK